MPRSVKDLLFGVKINKVNGNFEFDKKLTSLKGGPKIVGKDYDCSWNKLESLDWSAESIGGDLIYHQNPVCELELGEDNDNENNEE